LQRPRTIGGEKKRFSPQSKGKGDYWRRKKSYPPISKERVIGGGKKEEGGGMCSPHSKGERAMGRQKEYHKCWSCESSSQNRQLKMLNLIAQKWQVTNCIEKCVFARVKHVIPK